MDDGRKVITTAHPENSSGELKKNRCVRADFYFYFYFTVGYIFGHLGLFGKTMAVIFPEVSKMHV